MKTNITRSSVNEYASTRSDNTRKYYELLRQTTSDACYLYLKRDFLDQCLDGIDLGESTNVSELVELVEQKSQKVVAEQEKSNSFFWGLKKTIGKMGLSVILGIDMQNMPVMEWYELGESMLLTALYFNAVKQVNK